MSLPSPRAGRRVGRRSHRERRVALLTVLAVATTGCGQLLAVEPVGRVSLPPVAETGEVIAADGSVLAELHGEQDRDVVPLDRVPGVLRAAVVATEDRRFYTHAGVDARAIARAVRENVADGEVSQGGSTITQQLAKNALTGNARTLDRKLTEASLALQLEAQFTKDEILEQYLNTVYFGNGTYGVQAAAQRYFDVDVDALSLPQAALLAGLLRAPSRDDPFGDPDAAHARRNLVLTLMERQGRVTPADASAARAADLGVVVPEVADRAAPAFTDHVLRVLQHDPLFAVLGPDAQARADRLFREGLRIETTLDPDWQAAAEEALAATVSEPTDPAAALVAIDPATGSVRAMAATTPGLDATVAGFNLATQARRQPGSTFKSVLLAAALEQGHSLDEVFPAPAEVDIAARPPAEPEVWTVSNYDDADYGQLTLREATAVSANVVFAQLMERVGAKDVADAAWRLGVRRHLPPVRSLALGAVEVSPLELASVQATLAAGGVYREPTFVTRIVDADGELLWERPPAAGQRVLDDGVAWLVTGALRDVVTSGTGAAADLRRPTAGKTGTSQDGADAWFAGYTPDLAAAVWIGFPEGRVPMEPPRTRIRVEGGKWPAEAFARFGLSALAQVPASDFPLPSDALTAVRVDVTRGCLPNPFTSLHVVAERSYLAGTEPTEVCAEPAEPPRVEVPEVAGLGVEAAVERLEAAGFAVQRRAAFSTQLPPGFVVRQIPGPGEQALLAGFTATVFTSVADRSPVPIPDVLGQPLASARAALETAGFVVEVDLVCPDGAEVCTAAATRAGEVWEQSPATDAAPRASTVRLSAYPDA